MEENKRYAVLVSIAESMSALSECERSLDELVRLLNTAGAEAFCRVVQVKDKFDPRTCIGKGKVDEIRDICKNNCIELVVFDFELSPMQIRNLENDIGNDVTVIDRSMLILDIFALHAVTGEGKLQVELAQLKYSAPRLTGKGTELSRQGGGIGSRGPGESKLETDRRHLRERVHTLELRLKELEANRLTMRNARDRKGIFKVALVGYTNAGKSTLLNAITGANVLTEDKLFATLDPTTRKCELPSGESVLFSDTVGFIRKLPHHLIKAFKSTLDELLYADLLLIVTDATDSEAGEHIAVTESVISDLGASDKPRIYVFNKCDSEGSEYKIGSTDDYVALSARTGEGIDLLLEKIHETISVCKKKLRLMIPYSEQNLINLLYKEYSVSDVEYTDGGITLYAVLDKKGQGRFESYLAE